MSEGPSNDSLPDVLVSCLNLFGANLTGWFLPKGASFVHTQTALGAGPRQGRGTMGDSLPNGVYADVDALSLLLPFNV